jgi:hypothetical protein
VKRYKNLKGNSGIISYQNGKEFIEILFVNKPAIYVYSYSKCGKQHVERMKKLASNGEGLGTYINKHAEVKNNFTLRFEKGKIIKGKFQEPDS